MRPTFSVATALAATFALVSAQSSNIPTCGPNKPCPSDTPCCSAYGQCGVGAYCLGGCDPQYSYDLNSCVAAPVCKSGDFKLSSLADVQPNTQYLGDSSQANWVSSGTPVVYHDNSILLTMAPSTGGTLLMSTHYVWYGKISATLTTSQGAGVVTAFIMMSDVKDEIDFEFVGVNVETAQSNYYFQGITDYNNEKGLSVSNTVQNVHTYTFDWTPDTLTWYVDGKAMRTVHRADTWNTTTNQFHYPQSPARIELSLWPAGLQTNGAGTVAWSGGLVDWNSPYMSNGYYYAAFSDVNVQCYNPPTGFGNNYGSSAYYYTNKIGTNDTIAIGNNNTILSSFLATGDNPTYGAKPSGSASASTSSASMTATPETVPGISGGGNAGNSGGTGGSSGNANSGGGSSGGDSGSGVNGASGGQSTGGGGGFQQGTPSTGKSGASKTMVGSGIALLGFFVAALML